MWHWPDTALKTADSASMFSVEKMEVKGMKENRLDAGFAMFQPFLVFQ